MASFQAKIVWKRPRKREKKKNYRVVTFLPDALQKIPKKQQKSKTKIKKFHYGIIPRQNSLEKEKEGEKIKIIVSFRLNLTDDLKLQKNSKN